MADNSNAQGLTAADLAEAARGPSSFSTEGLSQTSRPLSELIAADKYQRKCRLGAARCPLAAITTKVIVGG